MHSSAPEASADAEGRQPLRELVVGVDAGDEGEGRAIVAPRLEGGDSVGFAFDDDLDRAVIAVTCPASDAQAPGLALARIPVPDALDPSSHDETSTDRHLSERKGAVGSGPRPPAAAARAWRRRDQTRSEEISCQRT